MVAPLFALLVLPAIAPEPSPPNPLSLFDFVEKGEGGQDSPYLRTILPSGSVILVENMPAAKVATVQLFVSARGVAENPQTHGWRHLLEHLIEKGPDKGLPARLETQGIFLTSETHRDALRFSLVGPPGKLETAIAAIREFLQPLRTDEAEVKRETAVLGEEIALLPNTKRLSAALWASTYGETALDPIGNLEVLAKASSGALELLRRRHFASPNLVIAVCGPGLDLDRTTRTVRALLPTAKDLVEPGASSRTTPKAASGQVAEDFGESVGASTPAWSEPETAATLAAALALAGEREAVFVIYTPSVLPGLVLLGSEESGSGLGKWLAGRTPGDLAALFGKGKALVEAWLKQQLADPERSANLRGFLASQSVHETPEEFAEAISKLTPAAFQAAASKFVKAATAGSVR